MKVLLINDFIECGGAELQTRREMDTLKSHGDDVLFLSFDPKNTQIDNNINIKINHTFIAKVYNKLFVNHFLKRKIKKIISSYNPDYIHINNIFACPITVYSAVKKYNAIQTIRDYGAVCSKTTCIFDDFSECTGYKFNSCKKCLKKKGFKAKFKQYSFKRINKFKFKTIKKFICPSEELTEKCKKNGYDIVCINNPFDFKKIAVKEKEILEKRIYLYYGMIEKTKGVMRLIEAFDTFSNGKDNVELHFIGKVVPEEEQLFNDAISNKENIKYLGYMKNDYVLEKLKEVYCVVVPSLWIENYPNTVLEPMANKTLVIGSNRGGIKGMIKNDNLLFNILDINDVVAKLDYTYNLKKEDYFSIVNSNYKKIEENNTTDKYYERLSALLKSISK